MTLFVPAKRPSENVCGMNERTLSEPQVPHLKCGGFQDMSERKAAESRRAWSCGDHRQHCWMVRLLDGQATFDAHLMCALLYAVVFWVT